MKEASSIEELRAERERAAEDLYHTSKSRDPVKHGERERRWNELNREVQIREGRISSAGEYRYRQDVREEFRYSTRQGIDARGQRLETVRAEGKIRNPDTVINWRQTQIGAKVDERTRQSVSRGTGDDAGHIVALEFGANPGEARNVSRQNPTQNQAAGTWRDMEARMGSHCRTQQHGCVEFQCDERYTVDKHGTERAVGRNVTASYGKLEPDGTFKRQEDARGEKLSFVNTVDYAKRRERTHQEPPKVDGASQGQFTREERGHLCDKLREGSSSAKAEKSQNVYQLKPRAHT